MHALPYTYFEQKVLKIAVDAKQKEWDSTFLLLGREGSSKSTLGLHAIESIAKLEGMQPSIFSVCQSLKDFITGLRRSHKGDVLMLDEGSDLASMRTMEGLSKAITKAYTVMRAKCLITFICFTNIMKLNAYFREDRVKGLIFMKKRGVAYFFTQEQLLHKILPTMKKNNWRDIKALGRFKPLFCFTFPKYEGQLLEAYLEQKDENIDDTLSDLELEWGAEEKTYSLNRAIKFIRLDGSIIRYLVETKVIPCEMTHSGKHIIKQSDLIEWKKKLGDKEIYASYKEKMLIAHPALRKTNYNFKKKNYNELYTGNSEVQHETNQG